MPDELDERLLGASVDRDALCLLGRAKSDQAASRIACARREQGQRGKAMAGEDCQGRRTARVVQRRVAVHGRDAPEVNLRQL